MMKCKDCRFWGDKWDECQLAGSTQALAGVKRCTKVIELWEATEWNEDYDRVLKPGLEKQLSFAMDGSSYLASFYTRPEFFCAHFEANEE